jgi:hypothetical protein
LTSKATGTAAPHEQQQYQSLHKQQAPPAAMQTMGSRMATTKASILAMMDEVRKQTLLSDLLCIAQQLCSAAAGAFACLSAAFIV